MTDPLYMSNFKKLIKLKKLASFLEEAKHGSDYSRSKACPMG